MFRVSLRRRQSLPYRLCLLVLALAVLNATLPQIVVHSHSEAFAEHGAAHEHAHRDAGTVSHDAAIAHADASTLPADPPDGSHGTTDGLHVHDATGVSAAFAAASWNAELPRLAGADVPPLAPAARPDFSPTRHHRPPIA